MSFRAIGELLWMQQHREVVTGFSVVARFFAAAAKAHYPNQKEELSLFLAGTILRRAPNGQT
jgi:hypothetical protein